MPELRVYLTLDGLQRQFAAYLSSPVPARGYVPLEGMHSLIIFVLLIFFQNWQQDKIDADAGLSGDEREE